MKHYPDIKVDHFVALLSLREDIRAIVRKVRISIHCRK